MRMGVESGACMDRDRGRGRGRDTVRVRGGHRDNHKEGCTEIGVTRYCASMPFLLLVI